MWTKLKLFFSKVWDFIAPTVQVLSQAAVQEFLPVALDAVKATAQYGLDNDEAKRKKAYDIIVAQAKAKGQTLSTSIVNVLIELALQKLKTK